MSQILINGRTASVIDVNDRGFQYGDGLFETILYAGGKLLFWQDHLARLRQGCERLGLPQVDESVWLDDIRQLTPGAEKAVIKLMLTRGVGGRGYKFPQAISTTRVTACYPYPDYPQANTAKGVNVISCKTPVSMNSALAGLKHINRLDNILARNEWHVPDVAEGLMYDALGNVIEGTMSNIFCVKDRVLYTPALNQAGVAGVIRKKIIQLAEQLSIPFVETMISKQDLSSMDEVFLTNSLILIWPVIKIDNNTFSIGEVSRSLISSFNREEGAHSVKAH